MFDVADTIIEGLTVLVFMSGLLVLLFFSRKFPMEKRGSGWIFIKVGFLFLLLGMVMDFFDEFQVTIPYLLFGTPVMEFAEEIIGHMLGGIFLTIGFFQLMPSEISRLKAEERLKKSNHSLDAKVNDLHEANARLGEEIIRREKTEGQLKIAKEQAEYANKAKSRFLATMSHDIRTPLNVLLGMMEMLKTTPMSKEQTQYAHISERSGEMLLSLVNDILDLSKIESSQLELDCIAFNIVTLVEETQELFTIVAEDKNILLECSFDSSLHPWRLGDPRRLKQILINLIGNALKFTKEGRIDISVEGVEYDQLRFEVKDTGTGIPKEHLNTIFQPYSQLNNDTSNRVYGTGLGLQICKELTKLMGGSIKAESQMGSGSSFHFMARLPVTDILQPRNNSCRKSVEPDLTTTEPEGLDILYADDALENRMVIEAYFKRTQHRLVLARDGQEALSIWRQGIFNMVILDLEMPELNGFETVRSIRDIEAKNKQPRTTVVAMSAHAMNEMRERSISSGFDDYLTKPMSRVDLLLFLEDR
jgi:signal transduction histidine kinase/CheY-like chemotaxis protein